MKIRESLNVQGVRFSPESDFYVIPGTLQKHYIGGPITVRYAPYCRIREWYINGHRKTFKKYCKWMKQCMTEQEYFTFLLTYS